MLLKLARFSKFVAKYEYYPLLIGFIALVSAIINGGAIRALALFIVVVCFILSAIALLKNKLCKMTGEDPEIR